VAQHFSLTFPSAENPFSEIGNKEETMVSCGTTSFFHQQYCAGTASPAHSPCTPYVEEHCIDQSFTHQLSGCPVKVGNTTTLLYEWHLPFSFFSFFFLDFILFVMIS